MEGALELGVQWLTVYAFSTENWRRPVDEVRFLMWFNRDILLRRRHESSTSWACESASPVAGTGGCPSD